MRTRRLFPIALSLLVLGATSCAGDDGDASGDDPATVTEVTVATPDTATPEAAEMEAAVEIADFAFGPAEVTIAAGGTVTWTNTDNQPHTATSSGNFDTGSVAAGSAVTVTFDQPGTFTYICSFHPFMTATVTVV